MAQRKNSRNANGTGTIRKKTVVRNGVTYAFWEARYTAGTNPGTGKPVRKSITGKTQKEVAEKLKEATHALDDGTYTEPNKITVRAWFSTWLNTFCKNKVRESTYYAYKAIVTNHIDTSIGAIGLQQVSGIDVQRTYNAMIDKGLSAKTVKNVSAVMHKGFSMAMKQGYILHNPCEGAELPKTKKSEIHPLTEKEIPLFLEAIKCDFMCNAYAVCLFAGLREGECLGLAWHNVDFKNGKITVCQQLQRREAKYYYIADTTKSGKTRVIIPPAITFDYLRAEQRRQIENRFRAGAAWSNPDDLVFTDGLGKHFAIATFVSHFKKIAAGIGRPDARVHDLRHTAATVAIASGADIKSVQQLLGHATAAFTLDVYAHSSEKMQEDTAARMQSFYDDLKIKRA
jgi:integrase